MQTFEEFYNQKMLEEQLQKILEGQMLEGQLLEENIFKSALAALQSVPETASSAAQAVANFPGEVAAYIGAIGDYTLKLGIAGVGGAVAAQALGALLQHVADKMDAAREDEAYKKRKQREVMVETEFEKALAVGEKLSEEQQMELLEDISKKWAEKYKIPEPKLFVKAMRKIGNALSSKLGTILAAVLAFIAGKMMIPFPTF